MGRVGRVDGGLSCIKLRLGTVPLAALTTERIDRLYRELEHHCRTDHRQGEGLLPLVATGVRRCLG